MNINLLTLTEVLGVEGQVGAFRVSLRRHPRYVDSELCISCGQCALRCPAHVPGSFMGEKTGRKAIFIDYPQAVPRTYRIDPRHCLVLNGKSCRACEKVCPGAAIRLDQKAEEAVLQVGSIVLAPGFRPYNPSPLHALGYGVYPNVITTPELERLLSPSGPTEGRLVRPSDGREVRRMAFLQCVGSRDGTGAGHSYCSSVCCMTALKAAVLAKEQIPDLDVTIYFLDLRTHGKDFERYADRAREAGVRLHLCWVNALEETSPGGNLTFRIITEDGKQARKEVDLAVLTVGMETQPEAVQLAERLGVAVNANRFAATSCFEPVASSRPGISVCGAFSGPKDIAQSVTEASAAASAAAEHLVDVRFSQFIQNEFPPERDVSGEEPRIGVFICHCGTNIAGVVNVEVLERYAAGLPHVVYVERTVFTCSEDTQELIRRRIGEERLNRVVVAACTPRTHESLFRETLKASGLNESLFELANIRNQVAWVLADRPQEATRKAQDVVRMAVAKAGLLEPLAPVVVGVSPQALVVGGGLAGLVTALGLADQGFPVHLVERTSELGGNARHLGQTWTGEAIPPYVDGLIARVREHTMITVHLKSTVTEAEGFVGNFRSTVTRPTGNVVVDHGVVILATGGQAFKPEEYGYGGLSQRVLTALEFDKLHQVGDERVRYGRSFVFIQCVGSREPGRPYCSRVCCTHSIQSAITLKEEDPARRVTILYRDIRTYGEREALYTRARELGVVFINYALHLKPNVLLRDEDLSVVVWDHVLHEPFKIAADVVILATAIVPHPEVRDLARIYKLPLGPDGFWQEAHAKFKPVEFAGEGVLLAGLGHYPKPVEESIAQARAAVGRAVTVLANSRIQLDATKALVDVEKCDGCALCVDVCPFDAITLVERAGKAAGGVGGEGGESGKIIAVHPFRCKGCGVCQATCPTDGVNVGGFSQRQLAAQVTAALEGRTTAPSP